MKRFLLAILTLLSFCNGYSQGVVFSQADSLLYDELFAISDSLDATYATAECIGYCDKIINKASPHPLTKTAENNNIKALYLYAVESKSISCMSLGLYQEGLDCLSAVDNIPIESGRLSYFEYMKCLFRIEMGQYQMALKSAKTLYESTKDSTYYDDAIDVAKARCWSMLCSGHANRELENYREAAKNYNEALDIIVATKDTSLYVDVLNAQSYLLQLSDFWEPQEALESVKKFDEQLKNFRYIQSVYSQQGENNVKLSDITTDDNLFYMYVYYASAYSRLSDERRAKVAFASADSILNEIELPEHMMADYYYAKAKYYDLIGQDQMYVAYSDSAANAFSNVSKPLYELKSLVRKMDGLNRLGRHDQIYRVAKRALELSDETNKQKLRSNAADMQTLMGLDKAEKEKADLEQRRQILEQRQRFYIMLAVAVLLIALLVIFWLRHRATKKEKAILAQQKELLKQQVDEQTKELRQQKDTIEAANRSITDSITYALHIQKAILPSFEIYAGNPGQPSGAFCFYQPCHIVSGDFYWAAKRGSNTIFACCDCTGHGVPGGFMSMLGTSVLADAVKNPGTENNMAELLELAHEQLLHTLEQSGDKDSRDGMDMAVIEYNPETSTITLSSANRTSMLFINGEWIQHKGVKRGIGERSFDRNSLPFQNDVFQVKKGDRIFLFSDGYPDQFGGPRNKKIGNKGVTAILEQTAEMPYDQLYQFISDKYWEWRGDCEQLDDISMLCVEI